MFPRSFSPEKYQAFDHAKKAGVEVIYENIGVDQDPDFCQDRISLRNTSSETLRNFLRIERT